MAAQRKLSSALALCLSSLLVICFVATFVAGNDDAAANEVEVKDYSKLRIKELKNMLEERGVECVGCVEKEHLVAKVKETAHLPVLPSEEEESSSTKDDVLSGDDYKEYDGEKIQELLRNLKSKKEFENIKMFTPDDLKKFTAGGKSMKDEFGTKTKRREPKTDDEAEL
eukprot:TRINITY_DN1956_c0_g2_i2.p1 TRINITY_DN1956_c0_g2~~TRINITY_DN1956_c0_g2_i2.p1  ORF type:complete len:169 (+),score=67.68 TRINITY_DN1956_c0_g2_i2:320-826(+)